MTIEDSVENAALLIVDVFLGLFAFIVTDELITALDNSFNLSGGDVGGMIVTILPWAIAIFVFYAAFKSIGRMTNHDRGGGGYGGGYRREPAPPRRPMPRRRRQDY